MNTSMLLLKINLREQFGHIIIKFSELYTSSQGTNALKKKVTR